jgi:ElaB/YqjD/DUF883 family membrane-anchored ribosome-binding protein
MIIATNSRNLQRSKDILVNDLKAIVGDADRLIRDMAAYSGDELVGARKTVEAKLAEARTRLDEARHEVARRACGAADATGEYIVENPWKVVGIASLAGLIAALVFFRRSH